MTNAKSDDTSDASPTLRPSLVEGRAQQSVRRILHAPLARGFSTWIETLHLLRVQESFLRRLVHRDSARCFDTWVLVAQERRLRLRVIRRLAHALLAQSFDSWFEAVAEERLDRELAAFRSSGRDMSALRGSINAVRAVKWLSSRALSSGGQSLADGLDSAARMMQIALKRKIRRDANALVFVGRAKSGLAGGATDGEDERHVSNASWLLLNANPLHAVRSLSRLLHLGDGARAATRFCLLVRKDERAASDVMERLLGGDGDGADEGEGGTGTGTGHGNGTPRKRSATSRSRGVRLLGGLMQSAGLVAAGVDERLQQRSRELVMSMLHANLARVFRWKMFEQLGLSRRLAVAIERWLTDVHNQPMPLGSSGATEVCHPTNDGIGAVRSCTLELRHAEVARRLKGGANASTATSKASTATSSTASAAEGATTPSSPNAQAPVGVDHPADACLAGACACAPPLADWLTRCLPTWAKSMLPFEEPAAGVHLPTAVREARHRWIELDVAVYLHATFGNERESEVRELREVAADEARAMARVQRGSHVQHAPMHIYRRPAKRAAQNLQLVLRGRGCCAGTISTLEVVSARIQAHATVWWDVFGAKLLLAFHRGKDTGARSPQPLSRHRAHDQPVCVNVLRGPFCVGRAALGRGVEHWPM